MTTPASPFADTITSRVLGVRELLAHVTPDSELARQQWVHPPLFTDYGARQKAHQATLSVEQWWMHTPDVERACVRRHLAQMPLDIGRVLTKLTLHELLGETELFVLKRLLYHALELCRLAAQALKGAREIPDSIARLSMLLETLHPEAEPSPRFHLSESLDVDLAEARQALTRARRAFMQRRKVLVDLKKEDYPGARFDLDGEVSLSGALATRAATDPGMTPHGGVWRLKDPELDGHRELVEADHAHVEQLEVSLRNRLSIAFSNHASWLESLTVDLTQLDLHLTRARLRAHINGCWPDAAEGNLTLEAGHDPGIPQAQPVDFDMDHRPAVITGPNMGGKSSLLRLIGLCQWCLQHGLPVPARAYCAPLLSHIIYVGSDELHHDSSAREGLSSFGREIRRLVEARAVSEPVTLWLLDEVGRGTHPDDGAALAASILEVLVQRGDRVFFATHFPALAGLDDIQRWRIAGLTDRARLEMLADADDFNDLDALELALREAMDYRPVRWARSEDAVPRDARLIARLLGW